MKQWTVEGLAPAVRQAGSRAALATVLTTYPVGLLPLDTQILTQIFHERAHLLRRLLHWPLAQESSNESRVARSNCVKPTPANTAFVLVRYATYLREHALLIDRWCRRAVTILLWPKRKTLPETVELNVSSCFPQQIPTKHQSFASVL